MTAPIPPFLYGTAWKEERSTELTRLALEQGFVGIDTANQRKHYFEAAVGEAVQAFLRQQGLQRSSLFLQSKYTYLAGQDQRLPYDPQAPFPAQVRQSFASSLAHFGTDYLDSYVLHGPADHRAWSDADREVWAEMEALQRAGQVRYLGVSNVHMGHLQTLWQEATIKPRFVQNRCYARLGWDADIRQFCQQHELTYQGFSLLTANLRELNHPDVFDMAQNLSCSLPQLVFAFALAVGMLPLTGTSQAEHMQDDLQAQAIQLPPEWVQRLEAIA